MLSDNVAAHEGMVIVLFLEVVSCAYKHPQTMIQNISKRFRLNIKRMTSFILGDKIINISQDNNKDTAFSPTLEAHNNNGGVFKPRHYPFIY